MKYEKIDKIKILRKLDRFFRPIILVCVALILTFISISRTSNANENHQAAGIDNRTEYQTVKIGVLAKRGFERCLSKWIPTADYLTDKIPGYSFTIMPLTFDEINSTVERGEVDFILTNPSFYVKLEYYYGVSRIATLKNRHLGKGYTVFGGVIFHRADRKDIKCLDDLKGKTFLAVKEESFGGWQTAWRELKEHGIDPYRDFTSLSFGGTHDTVVYAVRDGKVDAGSVRTTTLERMAKEGKIRLEDFRVITHDYTHKHTCYFPFFHSTETYPEWPFARVKHTSDELAEEVAATLLRMPADCPAAEAARCAGWTSPLNYQPVHECLKYLRLSPYQDYGKVTFQATFRQYWFQLACGFVVLIMIILYTFRMVRLNWRLKESEERVIAVFNQTFQFMALLELDGTLIEVNQTTLEFAGIEKKDVFGKPFWETIWWTHSAELQSKVRDAVKKTANGQFMDFEVSHLAHDGTLHNVDFSLKPVKDESDNIRYLVAEGHDITESKQAEELLQRRAFQQAEIARFGESAISSLTVDELFERAVALISQVLGTRYAKILEHRPEKGVLFLRTGVGWKEGWVGHRSVPDGPGSQGGYTLLQTKPVIAEDIYNETRFSPPALLIEHNVISGITVAIPGPNRPFGILGVHTDRMQCFSKDDAHFLEAIANILAAALQQRQTEEALRESEKRFKKLSNLTFEGILIHDKGVTIDINESLTRLLGYAREEMIGENIVELCIPREYYATIKENITKRYAKPYEVMARKKDGTLFPIEIEGKNVIGEDEELRVTAIRDITERKQAEEELRNSEEKFKTYISHAPDAIFIVDSQGRYVEVNEAACNLTGYSKSELTSMSIPDLADPQTLPDDFAPFKKLRETGHESSEVRLKRKDGSIIWASLDAVALSEDRFMAFCSDITETKRLQELESRAERLEMAGTIAGQVAHDFNNLLSPMIGYPEFIHEELPHDNQAHAYLDAIENAAKKIANINQDLLTMGRRGHYNQNVIDLNRVVLQAAQEMESGIKTVTIKMDLCEDIMKIKGGAAQINRMLTNLLVNAQDAMQDIGQVTIKTENYYADDTSIAFGRVPKGEYIKLTVSDNGCGIPDDIIQNILDPFFSTKTADKKHGSGLGLSVVDAVMKDHNGYLDLSSKVGHGTSFYLYFPVTREDAGDDESEYLTGGTETVLVVDDDDIQLEVSSQLLKKLGYKVSSVESGEKAIEFLRENPQDLLVLDMVMPNGIDGAETYRRILEISPYQKAIIVSGLSESDRVFEAQKLGAGAFVRKPVTKQVIAAAVRTELDRRVEVLTS